MKKAIFFLVSLVSSVALCAQNPPVPGAVQREPVRKANYALAERFSAKKVNQMVFSTTMRPNWFKSGNRFWYEWKTPAGSRYYIVDPDKGSKTEVSRFVREVAKDVPDSVENKSEWIEDRIATLLRFKAEAASNGSSARH